MTVSSEEDFYVCPLTCSCKKYENIHMPCSHKVAASALFGLSAFELFNPIYFTKSLKEMLQTDVISAEFNPDYLLENDILPFKEIEKNISKTRIPNVGLEEEGKDKKIKKNFMNKYLKKKEIIFEKEQQPYSDYEPSEATVSSDEERNRKLKKKVKDLIEKENKNEITLLNEKQKRKREREVLLNNQKKVFKKTK